MWSCKMESRTQYDVLTHFFFNRYFIQKEEGDKVSFTVGLSSGVLRTAEVLDREEAGWHNVTVTSAEVGKFAAAAASGR